MEDVVDKVVEELNAFADANTASGGCADILTIEAVYWGDPGVIPSVNFPCFTVQPVADRPTKEMTGREVRDLEILITLLVDARQFFDSSVDEASADRQLVQVMAALRAWFRRTSNRSLDGLAGVREVRVFNAEYMVQVRDSVIAKSAQVTLLVNRHYQRQS